MKNLRYVLCLLALTISLGAFAQQKSRGQMKEYEITVPFAKESVILDESDSLTARRLGLIAKSVSASYERDDSYVFQMTIRACAPSQEAAEQRANAVKAWVRTHYPSTVKLQNLRTLCDVKEEDAVVVSYMIISAAE